MAVVSLAGYGLAGANLSRHIALHVSLTVMLLCFIMGLQNAIITKISSSVIRTTHVTGMVTDLGIEFGKYIYWNKNAKLDGMVIANRSKMRLLGSLLLMFFSGGLAGVLGFQHLGFSATIPLAAILMILAVVPVFDDLRIWYK